MIATFHEIENGEWKGLTVHFSLEQGLDYSKLLDYSDLAMNMATKEISIEEAKERIETLQNQPSNMYPQYIQLLAYGACGALAPLLFFGGPGISALFGFVYGLVIGVLVYVLSQYGRYRRLLEFLCAIAASFMSFGLSTYVPNLCPFASALSAIVWLLPGLTIFTALTELAARSLISGAARLFAGLFSAFQLGFGLQVGRHLVWWAPTELSEIVEGCPFHVPIYLSPIWLVLLTLAFNILLGCRPSQWLSSSITAAIGWAIMQLSSAFELSSETSTTAAAFAVGLTGQMLANRSHHQPAVTVLCGILLLVPGGMSVRGIASLFVDTHLTTSNFGIQTTTIAFCISLGILLSKAIFPISRSFGESFQRSVDNTASVILLV